MRSCMNGAPPVASARGFTQPDGRCWDMFYGTTMILLRSVRPDWKFWPEPEPEPDCYNLAGTGTGLPS